MKIWTIANQKGGVGKTTTTITLAGILADQGIDTLMVDLDPQGSLSNYLGVDPETESRSVYDIFQPAASGRQIETSSLVHKTKFPHLSLMPASTALSVLEKQLGSQNGMGLVLLRSLAKLSDRYRYVLIDCPPMLGMLMVNALAACDHLIIPVQTEFLAIKGLQRMLRTLEMIGKTRKTEIDYTILPTMFDVRTVASKKSLKELQLNYKGNIFSSSIPVDTKFRDASCAGKPVSSLHPGTHGLIAYHEFLSLLLNEPQNTARAMAND